MAFRILIVAVLVLAVRPAWAHPMPSSDVLLRLRPTGIDAELTLPIDELALGWGVPLPSTAAETVHDQGDALMAYVGSHVSAVSPDGRSWTTLVHDVRTAGDGNDVQVTVTMTPAPGEPVGRLTIHYDVIFDRLITHTTLVSLSDESVDGLPSGAPILLGTLRDTNASLTIDRAAGGGWRGFVGTFRLGMRHIADGTDHLLFLVVLLLPAPLRASQSRRRGWGPPVTAHQTVRRIVGVVSAFTIGHSVTLVLGALGWVSIPAALVETAIALSILASALHALVPLIAEREAIFAASFGLVHGLAFAATLTGFGFDPITMASSILGFNLGIETFQLAILAITLPWLITMAPTPLYTPVRIGGAVMAAVAATAWALERAFGWSNPVGPWIARAAAHAPVILVALAALSATAFLCARRGGRNGHTHGRSAAEHALDGDRPAVRIDDALG